MFELSACLLDPCNTCSTTATNNMIHCLWFCRRAEEEQPQLSGEYLLSITLDGVDSEQCVHEIQLRDVDDGEEDWDVDDGEEDWDVDVLSKVCYNINRAKVELLVCCVVF